MTVKLALLKSGEDVIADIQEMIVGSQEDQKVVGYFFNKPCGVRMKTSDENGDKSYQISLYPWMPLSKDTRIPLPNDWVLSIVEPIETLKKMYEKDVLKIESKENDKINLSTEQSNPSITD